MRAIDPAISFIILLVIGAAAGFIFDRLAGPSWLARQFAGMRGIVTSILVGIAGSFVGFHLAILGGMIGLGGLALYVGAALGALVVLLLWRTIR